MRKSKFTIEQIAYCLTQAEIGVPIGELFRNYGISQPTFYRWRTKLLTVIDTYSRECSSLHVDGSLPSSKLTAELDRVIARRGKPQRITDDDGTEFTSNGFDAGTYRHGIALDFTRLRRWTENEQFESFNGRLRDECLNTSSFQSLEGARDRIEEWKLDDNEVRPHSQLV